jgi:ubiquinone/menaquinone biosynthesis C-methylase UbiE
MELRPSNRERNRRSVELLQIRPTDDVLEVGFGPGLAVQQIGAALTTGRVVGIDHSATMHQRASHKNAAGIREDKIDLRIGSVEGLAALGLEFDKALAINVHMFVTPRPPPVGGRA